MEASQVVEILIDKLLKKVPAVIGTERFLDKGYSGAGIIVHFKKSSFVLRITNLRTGK